jgi:polar amino acid transport system substrate-binding protein
MNWINQILAGFLLGTILIGDRTLAADLAEIQKRGTIVIGVKENLPPLGFRNGQGELDGLEVELSRQIAEQILGDRQAVTLKPLLNRDRIPALLNDDVDLVIAQLTMTTDRARVVDFSTPYYFDGTALVTREAGLQTLRDLRGKSVAVLQGSSAIAVLRSRLPNSQLVGVDSYAAAQAALQAGQVTAIAGDATVLTGWRQVDSGYRVLPQILSVEAIAVGMPRGLQYQPLRQAVNGAIAAWHRGGGLRDRVIHWGLPEDGVPDFEGALRPPDPPR